jgi:hypothetical protein
MTMYPQKSPDAVPPKGFLSDILADEEKFLEEKRNKLKPKTKVETTEIESPKIAEPEIEQTISSLDLNQGERDELFDILNSPPYYYVFSDIPKILIPPFENVKKVYFGSKMIDTARTMPNGTSQPIKIHKMFIALLIDPPKYEDILKSNQSTAHENSFGFNLAQECYYRWNLNIQNSEEYRNYLIKCESFGIKFVMNYSDFNIVNLLETDVREV